MHKLPRMKLGNTPLWFMPCLRIYPKAQPPGGKKKSKMHYKEASTRMQARMHFLGIEMCCSSKAVICSSTAPERQISAVP